MKDGKYVVTLDDYESVGTHWIALYINGDYVTLIALELKTFQIIIL